MTSIEITTATNLKDLQGIKLLQDKNLKTAVSPEEASSQGFLTAEYDLTFLEAMNEASPSIIAKDGDQVVGYALATTKTIGLQHDLLTDLLNTIDRTTYRSQLLKLSNYIVIGQLCVAKGYRGIGLSNKLYQKFRATYSGTFDYGITDVAEDNPGSLAAHLKAGFKVIDTLRYSGIRWHIVLWDWNV